jgi:colanic acid biosynthesis glycosyl transferase WcaI
VERQRPDIRIRLYGNGLDEDRLRREISAVGLGNVQLSGRIPASEIEREFACADALLLHLGAGPLFDITIPSKTQHYLAMGRPIIAAVNGEAAQLLRNSGAAIVVPPANPDALAAAIVQLADRPRSERELMAQAGARYYREHLSFSEGTRRTIALLEGTYQALEVG